MNVQKFASFSSGDHGGNPAGVALCETLPPTSNMQRIAAEVGFSETAFAAPEAGNWRVRYFAPEIEVPFCGHATIALGAALAFYHGDAIYNLTLNHGTISVEGRRSGDLVFAALQSPPTSSHPADPTLLADALSLFSLTPEDLDARIPPAVANAGANHLILALKTRDLLRSMHYDFATGKALMLQHDFATISLIFAESDQLFHARNPFASGGVYEDPSTGAAAAALGGYLRDIHWPHAGHIDIAQGEDMNMPSRIGVDIPPTPGSTIRVMGTARLIS